MGVTERRLREKENLRSQILSAAAELFTEEGFQAVSMRKIAEKIEYAPSTIYLYFKDKEELCGAIITEVFDRLTKRIEEVTQEPSLSAIEALKRGLTAYIEFGLEHPNHYAVAFGHNPLPDVPGEPTEADMAALKSFDLLRQCLVRCMDEGVIRLGDVELLSQTVWMFVHGVTEIQICSTHVANFPWAPREQVIETAIDLIVKSLKAEK